MFMFVVCLRLPYMCTSVVLCLHGGVGVMSNSCVNVTTCIHGVDVVVYVAGYIRYVGVVVTVVYMT